MTRRRLVVLVSAAVLFTLGIAAFVALLVVTRTEFGHEQIRKRFLEPLFANAVHGGTAYLGRVGGNFLDSVTVDSVAIREKNGELFAASGRVILKFDPRDLWDRRVFFRRVSVEHPYLHFVQRESGAWNFNEIFASPDKSAQPKNAATRSWGSFVVMDSTRARNATFVVTMPWHVDTSLHGTARDSALRYNLTRKDHVIRRAGTGYTRTYTWQNAQAVVSHIRLTDPDSNRLGREFRIASLDVDEIDPPFAFRRVSGVVRNLGDSVWFDVPHFDLPASTGVASGKIFWGHSQPVHYDITVRGDSVALDDVNWVYATLPRTGGGSMLLRIQNDATNPSIINYKLTKLDVRSTKSHLTGTMSFGTGLPQLLIRDVDLVANPVDFDLIRTLNGKALAYDWQGKLVGTVKARGGVLTNFYVDDARGLFYDAHVPGAVSRFTGHGELDIFQPAFTAFHGFDVTVSPLDLRTIEFLNPNFPRLGGVVSGSARLDSSWLDVRFSNARITHQDGPGEPSQFTGSGRVTYANPFMIYDVALNAEPLSLTMLARSYPGSPFRGLVSGPIRAKGTMPDLELAASLQGTSGAMSFEGRADLDTIGGLGAHGNGQFTGLDLRELLSRPSIPVGTFSGHYVVDLAAVSPSDIRGKAELALERTTFDGLRIYPSHATLRFADGRMYVDSLNLRTAGGTIGARGAIGLPKGPRDSLAVTLSLDSLGGLRRYLRRGDSSTVLDALADSLAGRLALAATVTGRLDSLDIAGKLATTEPIFLRGIEAGGTVEFNLKNARAELAVPSGAVQLRAEHVRVGGIAFDTVGATVNVTDRSHATFIAGAARTNGPRIMASGQLGDSAGAQSLLLAGLAMDVGTAHWQLASPTRLVVDSTRNMSIDSLLFRNADSASIALSATIPAAGAVTAGLRARNLPLADVGTLARFARPVTGLANLDVRVTGTKTEPIIGASASLIKLEAGALRPELVTASATFGAKRWKAELDLFRNGKSAVRATAMVPMDLTLSSAHIPNDSVLVQVKADSADLGILEAFARKSLDQTSGRLSAQLQFGGKWSGSFADLTPTGVFTIERGKSLVVPLGITLTDLTARATFADNKLVIDTLSASSAPGRPNNFIRMRGSVANPLDSAKRAFDLMLVAKDFHAIERRTKARLDVTIPSLRLTGSGDNVFVNGSVTVDRGQVFIPDPTIARKQLLDVAADTASGTGMAVGSTDGMLARLGLRTASVTVALGDEVKLKSEAADVKLSGSVQVNLQRTSAAPGSGRDLYRKVVDGSLLANSGTYTLDLGLARRDFTVTSGLVTFDASPNPDINISAIYRVKRAQKEDIGIIVDVKGPLDPGPKIEFASDQPYEISQSDLLSYLITNEPGFDFSTNAGVQALSFVVPTLSSFAASALRDRLGLGSVFDLVQFQGAAASSGTNGSADLGRSGLDFLYGATLYGQRQVGRNVFFSVNAGLCPFTQLGQAQGLGLSPLDALAGTLQYRFNPLLSLQASLESSTTARYCGATSSLTSLASKDRQWSFVLRRTWRF